MGPIDDSAAADPPDRGLVERLNDSKWLRVELRWIRVISRVVYEVEYFAQTIDFIGHGGRVLNLRLAISRRY
jgi:hypothetical protein